MTVKGMRCSFCRLFRTERASIAYLNERKVVGDTYGYDTNIINWWTTGPTYAPFL